LDSLALIIAMRRDIVTVFVGKSVEILVPELQLF
jgi:hypothetical protein